MIRKIELFLRGEFYLHIVSMFFIMIMIMQIALLLHYYLPLWILLPIPFVIGIAWELGWKVYKKKPINIFDIIGTAIGGLLAILILRLP